MKKIMKRISGVLCALMVMFYLVGVYAAGIVERISETDTIPADYAWTFNDFDKAIPFGTDDLDLYSDNVEQNIWGPNWSSARVLDDSKKGTFGVLYTHVGYYEGQYIDLRMTVTDYTLNPDYAGVEANGYNTNQSIWVGTYRIGIQLAGAKEVKVKYEFFISGTNTPIEMKGYVTAHGLTANQYMTFYDGVEKVYLLEGNDHLSAEGTDTIVAANGPIGNIMNPIGMAMVLFNGKGFELSYGTPRDSNYIQFFAFVTQGLTKIEDTKPTKTSNKTNVGINEEFTFTIHHYVPGAFPKHYYSSYVFTDTLDSCLDVSDASQLVIKTLQGVDVTNKFNVSINGQTITATLKDVNDADFYGKEYEYNITTKIKSSCDLSKYENGITNVGQITIDGKTMDTNGAIIKYIPETVTVPATDAFIPLLISCIAALLILIGITGYYFANKRKQFKK